eukprot:CAMPEP_0177779992 /NCGR_PEP_ID=MMETSP0491_2-20121128/16943_1 /TAXON_ID=63592 /ORGANISM="Tetraselmis chuii, Strain PLY429" /LENGTH=142 /DNA_ID=CAMNT_0019299689 /DNA_START=65 /DNA_END=490 /DNA_ORIENTATION=+
MGGLDDVGKRLRSQWRSRKGEHAQTSLLRDSLFAEHNHTSTGTSRQGASPASISKKPTATPAELQQVEVFLNPCADTPSSREDVELPRGYFSGCLHLSALQTSAQLKLTTLAGLRGARRYIRGRTTHSKLVHRSLADGDYGI